ncbi:hypothetical protein FHS40_003243 [Streptomyces spectabilis]|uniref:Uncharacterized protein n=1 Tax=Streptomyces spectabilis TaxID=68270 RepID=A0A7W8EUT0_STRST|nr:hypothetical protein [Streptomyces spectabilis]
MGHSLSGKIGREYPRVSVAGDRSIPEQHFDNVVPRRVTVKRDRSQVLALKVRAGDLFRSSSLHRAVRSRSNCAVSLRSSSRNQSERRPSALM